MRSLLPFFNQPLAKHTGLVILLVVFIHLARWVLTWQAQITADSFAKRFKAKADEAPARPDEINPPGASAERIRLNEQLFEIKNRAQHHLDVTAFFYTRYYMAITLFAIVGGTAAIALLFITRFGWGGVSPYVITVFLVMSGHAAFYGAFPRIFKQDQNIADNKKLYARYVALENEVKSFFTTGQGIDGKERSESDIIHYLDQQLAKLHNFAIGFDYTKVPSYTDTFDGLKK